MTAYGGRDDHLFVGAAAESQSFAPQLTVEQSQYQYDNLVSKVGCAGTADTLACLRSKSAYELQQQNTNIPYPGQASPPLYMWSVVIDGDLITDYTYKLFE